MMRVSSSAMYPRTRKRWTESENRILMMHLGRNSTRDISDYLGRTSAACQQQLYRLRWRVPGANGYFGIGVIARFCGVSRWKVRSWCSSGNLHYQKHHCNDYKMIHVGHLRDFLMQNPKHLFKLDIKARAAVYASGQRLIDAIKSHCGRRHAA